MAKGTGRQLRGSIPTARLPYLVPILHRLTSRNARPTQGPETIIFLRRKASLPLTRGVTTSNVETHRESILLVSETLFFRNVSLKTWRGGHFLPLTHLICVFSVPSVLISTPTGWPPTCLALATAYLFIIPDKKVARNCTVAFVVPTLKLWLPEPNVPITILALL